MTASPIEDHSFLAAGSTGTGIANLPNQRHKIVAKRGTHFTLMVCGESGVGKTTFVNTLFTTTIKQPINLERRYEKQLSKTVQIQVTRAELEEKMFKVALTVIDTPGFGDFVNNRDCWTPIIDFIDEQHEKYMRQEQQPCRSGMLDTRIHACLYFIKPTGHTLSPLDIECMKRLGTRVNLIPVIAKADTLTPADLARFKQNIRRVIAAQNIKVYSCLIESDDDATTKRNANIMAAMPFSVIGATQDVLTHDGRYVKGRQYTWGVAEVENDSHCDFRKLRSLLIRTHMLDLITTTQEVHYENYRKTQLEQHALRLSAQFKNDQDALRTRLQQEFSEQEQRLYAWEMKLRNDEKQFCKDWDRQMEELRELQMQLQSLY